MRLMNPPQLVVDTLQTFANFYRLAGRKDHDWKSIVTVLRSYNQIMDELAVFDYVNVSGPQVKLIKNAQLQSNEKVRKVSNAAVGINNLLLRVQDYYSAKQDKFTTALAQASQ